RLVNGSRFLRRMLTTSEAVQLHRPIKTNSMGLFATFSFPASTTMPCRLLESPTKQSLSVQRAFASVIEFSSYSIPISFANAFHLLSTKSRVFLSMRISSGHGRVNPSLDHFRVASTPIFDP